MSLHLPATRRTLLAFQGVFYLASGAWPIVHRSSFEHVTGPKTDFWLARTVGAVLAVAGAAMLVGARRPEASPESRVLAVGTAGALAAVDLVYAARGRISRVYLADAAIELGLAAGWIASSRHRARALPPPEIVSGESVGD